MSSICEEHRIPNLGAECSGEEIELWLCTQGVVPVGNTIRAARAIFAEHAKQHSGET